MADTARTLSALQTLLANNATGAIGAQDVRDVLVSTYPDAFVVKNAVADGVTDDTAVIQTEIDAAYDAGGGTVVIPAGDYGVTALTREFLDSRINVNIVGAGKSATILRKIGGTTTPVIRFYATGTTEKVTYSKMAEFYIIGNAKAHDGIRLERVAKTDLRSIEISVCDTGLDSLGGEIFSNYNCSYNSNNVGYMSRKDGSPVIRANMVNFFGGECSYNTTHGADLGDCSHVNFFGHFQISNGTTTDTATGSMVIRDTVDDEYGLSTVSMKGCFIEQSYGQSIKVEASSLFLTIKDTVIVSPESGNGIDCGVIKMLTLENLVMPTPGDTVISAAVRTLIIGGNIPTYTDNSSTIKIGGQDASRFYEFTAPMISMLERASASADVAGHGQLWVKNTTPCQLWFTDDAGTDTQIV